MLQSSVATEINTTQTGVQAIRRRRTLMALFRSLESIKNKKQKIKALKRLQIQEQIVKYAKSVSHLRTPGFRRRTNNKPRTNLAIG